MQTGVRGAQRPNPGNVTGMAFYRQQREQEAKKRAEAAGPVDVAAIWQEIRKQMYADAFEEGAAWAFGTLRDAGIDVDSVLEVDADEPGKDAVPQ